MYLVKVMGFSIPFFRCISRHERFRVLILRLNFRVQNVWVRDVSLVDSSRGLLQVQGWMWLGKCSKLNRACLQPLPSLLVSWRYNGALTFGVWGLFLCNELNVSPWYKLKGKNSFHNRKDFFWCCCSFFLPGTLGMLLWEQVMFWNGKMGLKVGWGWYPGFDGLRLSVRQFGRVIISTVSDPLFYSTLLSIPYVSTQRKLVLTIPRWPLMAKFC